MAEDGKNLASMAVAMATKDSAFEAIFSAAMLVAIAVNGNAAATSAAAAAAKSAADAAESAAAATESAAAAAEYAAAAAKAAAAVMRPAAPKLAVMRPATKSTAATKFTPTTAAAAHDQPRSPTTAAQSSLTGEIRSSVETNPGPLNNAETIPAPLADRDRRNNFLSSAPYAADTPLSRALDSTLRTVAVIFASAAVGVILTGAVGGTSLFLGAFVLALVVALVHLPGAVVAYGPKFLPANVVEKLYTNSD